jgi:hypothetical protein
MSFGSNSDPMSRLSFLAEFGTPSTMWFHIAMVAVDVDDAVGAARGARKLDEQSRQTAVGRIGRRIWCSFYSSFGPRE